MLQFHCLIRKFLEFLMQVKKTMVSEVYLQHVKQFLIQTLND